MPISKLSRKRYKVVDRTITNHTPKPIRLMKTVAMDIKLYVAMLILKYSKPVKVYRGKNAVYRFLEEMLKEVEHCKKVVKTKFNKPLIMIDEDEANFEAINHCHICGNKYTDKDVRVRDHCHITGKFRGKFNIKVPAIFHNLRGYDSHFIMQQI